MQPAWIRHERGFRATGAKALLRTCTMCSAGVGATVLSSPAIAIPIETTYMSGVAPIAIAVGALGFGVLASALVLKWRKDSIVTQEHAQNQLSTLRAELDETQAILEGMPEITLRWQHNRSTPLVHGPIRSILPLAQSAADVLNFGTWLDAIDTETLALHSAQLRNQGQPFDLKLTTLDGINLRITGRVVGSAAIVRVRSASVSEPANVLDKAQNRAIADTLSAQAILSLMDTPAWVRNDQGQLSFANASYRALASTLSNTPKQDGITELFPSDILSAHANALNAEKGAVTLNGNLADTPDFEIVLLPLEDGSAGYLRQSSPASETALPIQNEALVQIGSVINALNTPIAIFNSNRELVHANSAYCELWALDKEWLKPGLPEQTILDRMRTNGSLPAEVDYRAWRTEHLKSYSLTQQRETLWYLPNGRAVNTISMPIPQNGGVIYVFDDMTEKLALESRYNALTHVQSETLNALSEGVAVFGTNGRLTLHNPRLSSLWKIPMNALGLHPHIDQIGQTCGENIPDDGAMIWRDLKQSIIDLNPSRKDKSGRINRSDGRLIDFAAIKLPDGQTLLTFVDVTEGASYQQVLKERNDALITADRLKDAFVQNVSYELRSPLTNIIGFADLLASDTAGPLNEKQRAYTDYIRTSSATLGVLIDNILDLATVDAGIAELDLEEQDITKLVDLARAGLTATFSVQGSETPLNFVVDIADNLPRFVADGTRIVQILYNLLANAARFSDAGAEVRLTISARGDERIVFTVDDEGVGISDEIKASVFQRFEGKPTEGRQRGAGLGLAIVRTFVNLHGGTISMEERQPKGTRVVVNLPAHASDAINAAE